MKKSRIFCSVSQRNLPEFIPFFFLNLAVTQLVHISLCPCIHICPNITIYVQYIHYEFTKVPSIFPENALYLPSILIEKCPLFALYLPVAAL